MAIIPGSIPVTGFIAPTDDSDIFPVTDSIYGIDGLRNVSGHTERNSISIERRRAGMLVGTQNDQNTWKLLPSPWTQTSTDWELFISSGATAFLTGGTSYFSASTTFVNVANGRISPFNAYGSVSYSDYSSVLGGSGNIVGTAHTYSIIAGGLNNSMTDFDRLGTYGFIGAGNSNVMHEGENSAIVGGYSNKITGSTNFIGSGEGNKIDDTNNSFIGTGMFNYIYGSYSFIGTGYGNKVNTGVQYGNIVGGYYNEISTNRSFIGSGYGNRIQGVNDGHSSIIGGYSNTNTHGHSHIVGSNITSVSANTTHVEKLNIKQLNGTTAVTSIALDANGQVVDGAALLAGSTSASNGLSESGGNITLGGVLTGDTSIGIDGNLLALSGGSVSMDNGTGINIGTNIIDGGTGFFGVDNYLQMRTKSDYSEPWFFMNADGGASEGKFFQWNLGLQTAAAGFSFMKPGSNHSQVNNNQFAFYDNSGLYSVSNTFVRKSVIAFIAAQGSATSSVEGSVAIATSAVTMTDNYTLYTDKLNLVDVPANDDALTQMIVRDGSTGTVKYRDVESIISGATSGITASNGLTKSGNNITLGGALTGDTFIDNAGFLLRSNTFSADTMSAQTIHTDNLMGFSPITIHDSLQYNGSTSFSAASMAFGVNTETRNSGSTAFGENTIAGHFQPLISSATTENITSATTIVNSSGDNAIFFPGIDVVSEWESYVGETFTLYGGSGSTRDFEIDFADNDFGGTVVFEINLDIVDTTYTAVSGVVNTVIITQPLIDNKNSFAGGKDSFATGDTSFAHGLRAEAHGDWSNAFGLDSIAIGGSSLAAGRVVTAGGIYSQALGFRTETEDGATAGLATGRYSKAGRYSFAGGFGTASTRKVIATGDTSFAFFHNLGGGVLPNIHRGAHSDNSAILGGVDHDIQETAERSGIFVGNANLVINGVTDSVILGGDSITAVTSSTVYVPNLNIDTAPSNDNALTQILARDTDGTVKYVDSSTFAISGSNTNIANTDLTLDAERTHQLNGNNLSFSGSGDVIFEGGGSVYSQGAGGISGNTAFGKYALSSNTTADRNTAYGESSLQDTTTGRRNTAVGYDSMINNIDGFSNTAIGDASLSSNTTGFYNTASGVHALRYNTEGAYNTATGLDAMHDNITGDFNVAHGLSSLRRNTDGDDNVVAGVSAGRFNTIGNKNVATGRDTLYSNSTGSTNSAYGGDALYTTSGSSNVGLGFSAGYYHVGSNKLFIDNQDRTDVATELTSALIVGDFSAVVADQRLTFNANVGIGTTASSSYNLEVTGTTSIGQGLSADTITVTTTTAAPLNLPVLPLNFSSITHGDVWVSADSSSGMSFMNVVISGVTKSVEITG